MMPARFDPFTREMIDSPYEMYRSLREHAPVYHNDVHDFWALATFDHVQAASRNWEVFSSASGTDLEESTEIFGAGNVVSSDPPDHTRLRAVLQKHFVPGTVALLRPSLQRRTDALVSNFCERGSADLATELAWALPATTISALLGVPEHVDPTLSSLVDTAFAAGIEEQGFLPGAKEAAAEIRSILGYLLEDPATMDQQGLLGVLAEATHHKDIVHDEAVGLAFMLYAAGTDTTACLISNALLFLDEQRDLRETLLDDPSLIPAALEEILRLESPLQFQCRRTNAPVVVGDQEIPSLATVVLLYGSANRDETRFDDAEQPRLDRGGIRHLAFGHGLHACIGAPLARAEAEIALTAVLSRLGDYSVSGDIARLEKRLLRGLVSLPVSFEPSPA